MEFVPAFRVSESLLIPSKRSLWGEGERGKNNGQNFSFIQKILIFRGSQGEFSFLVCVDHFKVTLC